ncbi:hypothetical protein X975_10838, partial [Stegodyphus mimosarum]
MLIKVTFLLSMTKSISFALSILLALKMKMLRGILFIMCQKKNMIRAA